MKKLFYGNPICKRFGHKWKYSINSHSHSPQQELRACKRCGVIEEYRRDFHSFGTEWFQLVMRSYKAALKNLSQLAMEEETRKRESSK